MSIRPGFCLVVLLAICTFAGCRPDVEKVSDRNPEPKPSEFSESIKSLVESEELILALTPRMKEFLKLLEQSDGSDDAMEDRPPIQYTGLAAFDWEIPLDDIVVDQDWPLDSQTSEINPLRVWQNLRDRAKLFDTQIGVLRGSFKDENTFEMLTKFEGKFRQQNSDRKYGLKGKQKIVWSKGEEGWSMSGWHQKYLHVCVASQPMFADVTESAIPDAEVRERVLTSSHEELLHKCLREKSREAPVPEYAEFIDWESGTQFPAATVADYDGDGWDDVLVMDRWSPIVLLRNKGDGTFEDVTEAVGLDVEGFANCACFFDFDNDGDKDLFVGRTLYPSKFFRNDNGTFVLDSGLNTAVQTTRFVIGCSTADINGDGLLDLYLATYAFGTGNPNNWVQKMIEQDERAEMLSRLIGKNMYLDRGGPPNYCLMNRGDSFEKVELSDDAKVWRNSFQGVWSDFDDDGDVDLYVCNDFAPDTILRNDTSRGGANPVLVDVTDEVLPKDSVAFGMGASFGDFNKDGKIDIYISNMYSKAGLRIVPQAGETDKRILPAAKGNFLYLNRGERFEQVAGDGPDQQHVSIVGWSFGGQFADFDNDGELDLFVPSGYFSAPKYAATDQDL